MQDNMEKSVTVPIGINVGYDEYPHFFIKWSTEERRYRISTSFKTLNKKWGLKINIIRDLTKISSSNLEFLYQLVSELRKKEHDNSISKLTDGMACMKITEPGHTSEIFFIERTYDSEISPTIVFFSLDHWDVEDYLEKLRERREK